MQPDHTTLQAQFFDGRSARGHRVTLRVEGDSLHIAPLSDDPLPEHRVPLRDVRWPERTRHGARVAQLADGGSLHGVDSVSWDAWVTASVRSDSWLVRAQQSWRGVAAALVLLVAVLGAFYIWGLPVASRGIVTLVPTQFDEMIGAQAFGSLDNQLLEASEIPMADQQRIRAAFGEAITKAWGPNPPTWRLEFRKARSRGGASLGANAFALPGGTMVITDQLVKRLGDDDAVLGVLGHEFGHVRQRHGMRQLVQASVLGAVASVAFGDYGTLITAAPVLLATMSYSRDAEREADDDAIHMLKANGISPLVMLKLFEAVRAQAKQNEGRESRKESSDADTDGLGIAFSSHPADEERMARFRAAAAQR